VTFNPLKVLQVKAFASAPVELALQFTHLLFHNTNPSAQVLIFTNY
jgi:hypothetical protein